MGGKARERHELPTWIWLWPPFAIVAIQIAAKAVDPELYRRWIRGEHGLVENLTAVILLVAVVAALRAYRLHGRVRSRWFGSYMIVMAGGCLFFALEEISYGQHWLGFGVPEDPGLFIHLTL